MRRKKSIPHLLLFAAPTSLRRSSNLARMKREDWFVAGLIGASLLSVATVAAIKFLSWW